MTEIDRLTAIRDYHAEELNKYNALLLAYDKPAVDIAREFTPNYIIDGVCAYYNITRFQLTGHTRLKEVIRHRRMAIKLLNKYTKCTLKEIATYVGLTNHATALHHLRIMDNELSEGYYGYDDTKKEFKQITKLLNL